MKSGDKSALLIQDGRFYPPSGFFESLSDQGLCDMIDMALEAYFGRYPEDTEDLDEDLAKEYLWRKN